MVYKQAEVLVQSRPASGIETDVMGLGLNQYEAKVYFALVGAGTSTAKTISDVTGIPYGKVYEVIKALAKKGFVIILPTKPMKFQAVSPKEAATIAKRELKRRISKLDSLIEHQLEPLYLRSRHFSEPESIFWVLTGRAAISRKIEDMVSTARRTVYIFTTRAGLQRNRILREQLKAAANRGVKIVMGAPSVGDGAKRFFGMKVVETAGLFRDQAANYASFDGAECVLFEAIPDDGSQSGRDIGLWVLSESFTRCLDSLFANAFSRQNNSNARDVRHA